MEWHQLTINYMEWHQLIDISRSEDAENAVPVSVPLLI